MSEWPQTGAQSQGGPYTHAEGTAKVTRTFTVPYGTYIHHINYIYRAHTYMYDSPRAKGTVKVTHTYIYTLAHYIAVNLGSANEVGRTPQTRSVHCTVAITSHSAPPAGVSCARWEGPLQCSSDGPQCTPSPLLTSTTNTATPDVQEGTKHYINIHILLQPLSVLAANMILC